ncbi:hypothetical protein N185_32410 [Sinorhizobium sp. GW3]|nr:hypothetical protein N185_32410 [Sinorhizobium sp. GW3]
MFGNATFPATAQLYSVGKMKGWAKAGVLEFED